MTDKPVEAAENLVVLDEDEAGDVGEQIVGRSEAEATADPEAPAEAPAATEIVEVEKTEPEAEDLVFEEGKQIVLDQSRFDSILSGRLKKEKKRIEELETELQTVREKQHSSELDKLAVGGVKRAWLERSGLKGQELEAFAKELAEGFGSGISSTLKLEDAVKSVPVSGSALLDRAAPNSIEAAMASISLAIDHKNGE